MLDRLKIKLVKFKNYLHLLTSKNVKFNVGSAGINNNKEWFATDINILDLTNEKDWRTLLWHLRVDNIMAEHVWEHLNDMDTELANKNCFKFLKKNGVLRLAVPDGFNPNKSYIDYVRPGGYGAGADDHKILYNYQLMAQRLIDSGFKVKLLEYWDEYGKFNYTDWDDDNGHIRRSRRYDPRNQNGLLGYTSLIVDAIKE